MAGRSTSAITGAMTVDVEDYFQVAAFAERVRREDWDSYPCRVERNVDRILGRFADNGVSATFFTLGWVAKSYTGVVRRSVDEGHETTSQDRRGVVWGERVQGGAVMGGRGSIK